MMAMCWKCANRITEKVPGDKFGGMVLVGCKEESSIKGFDDAQEKCPLIQENSLTNQDSGV